MLADRDGTFLASVIEHSVANTGKNNLCTFVGRYRLEYEFVNNDCDDVSAEDMEITDYQYLEKKDGSINTITVENLKEVFGWDGVDPFWLADTDLTGKRVKLVLEWETYEGKTKVRVKYLNSENSTRGGIPRATDAERAAIKARLGSKLRAQAGGTPVKAPPPTGKPKAPPAPKPAAKLPSPTGPSAVAKQITTKELAWENWQTHFKGDDDQKHIAGEWSRILSEMYPGRDVDSLTADEWVQFANDAPANILPF